ncbi:glycoside hydrolase family 26 protein [Paenibacillus sp. S-38]|uniref:glycoside hydrolase family 26 protein n=1 Tax=Paenibacillus sp. S-38 TaxID=3416710 RepID=UPI003CFB1F2B
MNNKTRPLFSVLLGLLLLLLLWAAFRWVPYTDAPPAGERQAEPVPQTLTDYWASQAEAAEKAGQTEAASNYQTRLEVHASLLAASPSASPETIDAAGTELKLYLRTPRTAAPDPGPPAKFEPVSGTYLGMLGADSRVRYDVTKVEQVYGRRHALYLSYVGWRKLQTDTDTYFPKRTAERVRALDGALQIGWEPRYGLQDVLDDEYVRRFAREAKASGIPVFLRYASEMNGAWVPWHGDPDLYIEKFRLIHDILEQEAPNVAMVWSPNFSPADGIEAYYPGDDYVDWVGFSLYSTPVTDGMEDLQDNVIDAFAPLYAPNTATSRS